ncbi:MAG: DegT/DnrJ/EryC1/StrS family aminotransferase [Myxococcota bacterium]
MTDNTIPIAIPALGHRESEAVLKPLQSGWVAQGPEVAAFERNFAQYTQSPYALACSSGTAALHLALSALGVGPGDEVVVPGFTWVATANVVELLGARAVLCDIDPDTFVSTPDHFEAVLSPRTKALMPVHLFGFVADMPSICALAARHGCVVVEDAACAAGSFLAGQHAGSFGDLGAFSFHPRKVITCGEGGLVLARDSAVAARVASLRNHGAEDLLVPPGMDPELAYDPQELLRHHPGARAYVMADFVRPGFNYRMTDIQGAVIRVQLDRLDGFVKRRRELAQRYHAGLAGLPLVLPHEPEEMVHAYQAYVVRVRPEARLGRDGLADALARRGIQTRQGTHALHLLGAYRERCAPSELPGCLEAHRRSLALPIYPDLTDAQLERIVSAVQDELG